MKFSKSIKSVVASSFALAAMSSQAGVLNVSATSTNCDVAVTTSTSPITLPVGNSCVFRAYNELQNVVANSLPAFDIGGSIANGTRVNSHLLVWNPPGSSRVTGTVSFDGPILGIYTEAAGLNGSDALFGLQPSYTFTAGQGLERGDSIMFISMTSTSSFDFTATNPGDYVRVITAVPEPGVLSLLALGLIPFVRRKKAIAK